LAKVFDFSVLLNMVNRVTAPLQVVQFQLGATETAANQASAAFDSMRGLATAGAALVGSGLAIEYGLYNTVLAASDLSETVSKSGAVFGKSSTQLTSWSKNSSSAIGLSEQSAIEAVATYGNLFVAMNLPTQKALEMSERLTGLAGDLASFNNVSVEDALLALRSGLTGETEPLKRFGINLNESILQQKAVTLGLVTITQRGTISTDQMTAAVKAQAAYALILEQTRTAQGDFSRTSGGMANQLRILAANIGDLKARLGAGLLPTVQGGLQLLNSIVGRVKNWADQNSELVQTIVGVIAWIAALTLGIGGVLSTIAAARIAALWAVGIFSTLSSGVQIFRAAFMVLRVALLATPIGWILAGLGLLVSVFIHAYNSSDEFRSKINFTFTAILYAAGFLIGSLVRFFTPAWNWIQTAAVKAFGVIQGGFQFFTDIVIALVTGKWATVTQKLAAAWTWLKTGFTQLWRDLPAILSSGWNGFKTGFNTAWGFILKKLPAWFDFGAKIVQAVIEKIGSVIGNLVSTVTRFMGNLLEGLGLVQPEARSPLATTQMPQRVPSLLTFGNVKNHVMQAQTLSIENHVMQAQVLNSLAFLPRVPPPVEIQTPAVTETALTKLITKTEFTPSPTVVSVMKSQSEATATVSNRDSNSTSETHHYPGSLSMPEVKNAQDLIASLNKLALSYN
jgi:hypothetical protein